MTAEAIWSERAARLFVALFHSGASYAEIAASTGQTQQGVSRRVRQLQLQRQHQTLDDIAEASHRFAVDGQRVLMSGKLG